MHVVNNGICDLYCKHGVLSQSEISRAFISKRSGPMALVKDAALEAVGCILPFYCMYPILILALPNCTDLNPKMSFRI